MINTSLFGPNAKNLAEVLYVNKQIIAIANSKKAVVPFADASIGDIKIMWWLN